MFQSPVLYRFFLEFCAKAVADFDFDATVRAETRAIATVPFYIGTRFDKGYLQLLNGDDLETTSIVFEDPSFDGTKGELLCSAGLQIEAGLNLAKLAEAHIDPTAKAVLNVNGTVSGDTTAGCANLNWDIYGELECRGGGRADFARHIQPIEIVDNKIPCTFAGDQIQKVSMSIAGAITACVATESAEAMKIAKRARWIAAVVAQYAATGVVTAQRIAAVALLTVEPAAQNAVMGIANPVRLAETAVPTAEAAAYAVTECAIRMRTSTAVTRIAILRKSTTRLPALLSI